MVTLIVISVWLASAVVAGPLIGKAIAQANAQRDSDSLELEHRTLLAQHR